ncbi:DUF2993 domain-containing protein [Streptomyces antnestii]|uniref:DUF2993 domain-containing protein n=1 Tax=Streptomyces antnestii TaxID=2494256 RepID=A0A3S2YQF7_9ACTN|nr:DUF2993 domain-containing protein [Streptomyces sp. San01]RVU17034.1 DUF2993 domain-containing protein [Streptomyces sp. San01]
MRALRVLLIVVVILGGLFVIADRVALNFAENEAADRVRTSEGLHENPDVSIKGFPFLTQLAGGRFDDIAIRIDDYDLAPGDGNSSAKRSQPMRIDRLTAEMHGVAFSGDYSAATADRADGTAHISYPELLKAAQIKPVDVAPGLTAKVVGLSDGGNGKVKVDVEATVLGRTLPRPIAVMSSVKVSGETLSVVAEGLPRLAVPAGEKEVRSVTDFSEQLAGLPAGLKLDKIEAVSDGVDISVKGTHVRLAG